MNLLWRITMKIMKRFFTFVMAMLMAFACTMTLAGCSKADIKNLQLTIQLYDYANDKQVEYTMDIDLYGHLAPKTVDAIVSYVNENYYNDTVFYKTSSYDSQIMIGDYKFDDELLVKNAEKPTLAGEFTYGGQKTEGGSPLSAKKGTIGLWRSWYAQDDSYTGRNATNSGSATWFIPTQDISSYNDYFCIFAQYDLDKADNQQVIDALTSIFANEENYATYVVYYTGEYDSLQYHCVAKEDFDADKIEDLFEAKDNQLVCYNKTEIKVPVTPTGAIAAKIVSGTVAE